MKSLLIVRTFFGADYEARTRYLHLGKVALYQMSYGRILHVASRGCCSRRRRLLYRKPGPLSTPNLHFLQFLGQKTDIRPCIVQFAISDISASCHRTSDDMMQRCLKLQIARCRAECRSFAPKIAKNADWVLTTAPACGIIIDVAGNNTPGTPHGVCGRSSSGRAPPCQGGGSEFEPRNPLQKKSLR